MMVARSGCAGPRNSAGELSSVLSLSPGGDAGTDWLVPFIDAAKPLVCVGDEEQARRRKGIVSNANPHVR